MSPCINIGPLSLSHTHINTYNVLNYDTGVEIPVLRDEVTNIDRNLIVMLQSDCYTLEMNDLVANIRFKSGPESCFDNFGFRLSNKASN